MFLDQTREMHRTRKARARADLDNARRLHALRADIIVGTDAGFGNIRRGEIRREFEGLHASGLDVAALVHAATCGAASIVRRAKEVLLAQIRVRPMADVLAAR
uniref:Uncharacterized protein n=1 Tax=Bosea sp. NBC_00436 TaxID=2969620 RepID=A0A9E8CP92_9HYPH